MSSIEPFSTVESQNEPPILTVGELFFSLKQFIENKFRRIRVRGEVLGLKRHTSGHFYFSLKDQDAVIDGICWRGTSLSISLEEGLEIIATGRITTYPGRSKYQVVIEAAEAAGQGALLKLLLERKQRLAAEGLFQHKRPLPIFPSCIGIITSLTGAVLHDILHRLSDRYPCSVLVWPVSVQGAGAAEQIASAIHGFNGLNFDSQPDVLIVARGGGSLEDLWAFNEEVVVRAAAASAIPLISAVGHETDTTLIDYAADLRAPTPTAAAEKATPVSSQVLYTLRVQQERLISLVKKQLEYFDRYLYSLGKGIGDPRTLLEGAMLRLDDWGDRLIASFTQFIRQRSQRLEYSALRPPFSLLRVSFDSFEGLYSKMKDMQSRFFEKPWQNTQWLGLRLEQSSYQRILERGFCWISSQDRLIPSATDLRNHKSETLTLHFSDGKVQGKFLLD